MKKYLNLQKLTKQNEKLINIYLIDVVFHHREAGTAVNSVFV